MADLRGLGNLDPAARPSAAGSAGSGDGRRPLAPPAGGSDDAGAVPSSTDPDGYRTVRDGDTLSGIADAYRLSGGWPALFHLNQQTVGENPDALTPGEVLRLRP